MGCWCGHSWASDTSCECHEKGTPCQCKGEPLAYKYIYLTQGIGVFGGFEDTVWLHDGERYWNDKLPFLKLEFITDSNYGPLVVVENIKHLYREATQEEWIDYILSGRSEEILEKFKMHEIEEIVTTDFRKKHLEEHERRLKVKKDLQTPV